MGPPRRAGCIEAETLMRETGPFPSDARRSGPPDLLSHPPGACSHGFFDGAHPPLPRLPILKATLVHANRHRSGLLLLLLLICFSSFTAELRTNQVRGRRGSPSISEGVSEAQTVKARQPRLGTGGTGRSEGARCESPGEAGRRRSLGKHLGARARPLPSGVAEERRKREEADLDVRLTAPTSPLEGGWRDSEARGVRR